MVAPPAAAVGPPFGCQACRAEFASRNALFRHLRREAACADSCEMSEAARCRPNKLPRERPAPVVQAAVAAERRKKDSEPKRAKGLQIETRPDTYQAELEAKTAAVEERFADCADEGGLPAMEIFASPPEHFRQRAEFDIWRDDSGLHYVMFDSKRRVAVERYPMGSRAICETLMPALLATLRQEEQLLQRLFQVNFHTTLSGDALVSLLYHTPYARAARRDRVPRPAEEAGEEGAEAPAEDLVLTAEWLEAAARLQTALGGASVVGHTRGRKSAVGRDWVEERLEVAGAPAPLSFRQPEGGFSQPNGAVAQHMVGWARAVAREDSAAVGSMGPPRDDDLLELYCGNGNFAVALAPCFRRVFATELVKSAVEAAKVNAEANGASNVCFARISSEELTQALDESRTFQRLAHVDLSAYNLGTVLVDPPRAGLGAQVSAFVARFPRIVYISCNPQTMHEDLELLRETHSIRRIAAFDQFPYTDHLEMGMLLVRRGE